jgi:hypothetical protein
MKESYDKELERILNQFQKYHMEILLGNFSAKVERERVVFKATIGK